MKETFHLMMLRFLYPVIKNNIHRSRACIHKPTPQRDFPSTLKSSVPLTAQPQTLYTSFSAWYKPIKLLSIEMALPGIPVTFSAYAVTSSTSL